MDRRGAARKGPCWRWPGRPMGQGRWGAILEISAYPVSRLFSADARLSASGRLLVVRTASTGVKAPNSTGGSPAGATKRCRKPRGESGVARANLPRLLPCLGGNAAPRSSREGGGRERRHQGAAKRTRRGGIRCCSRGIRMDGAKRREPGPAPLSTAYCYCSCVSQCSVLLCAQCRCNYNTLPARARSPQRPEEAPATSHEPEATASPGMLMPTLYIAGVNTRHLCLVMVG